MMANDIPVSKGLLKIIYEKGVEVQLGDDGYRYYQSVRHGIPIPWIPSDHRSQYGLRPILLVYDTPPGQQEELLSPTDRPPLDIDMYFNVETTLLIKTASVQHFHDLIYAFGAIAYHCKHLAYEYCSIAKQFARTTGRYDGEETGECFAFVHNCNVFYEIDALITATIRCYSIIRIVLWEMYCTSLGARPASFNQFLNKSINYIPKTLHSRLNASWNNSGNKAKDYRDFVQHYYTLTETGWPLPKAKRLESNIWCVSVLLPDNPEKKSRAAFEFNRNIDALTYGWELVGQMETVFLEIAHSLPNR